MNINVPTAYKDINRLEVTLKDNVKPANNDNETTEQHVETPKNMKRNLLKSGSEDSKRKKKKSYSVRKIQFHESDYKVSCTSCVWLCPNAKVKDHVCKFALCDKCYIEIAPVKKRRRSKLPKKQDNRGEVRCNHNAIMSLEQFFDEQYFTQAWKDKILMEKGSFPVLCNNCRRNLVS